MNTYSKIYFFYPRGIRISSQKGFTLLELIITIIILGVLSSLAVPQIFSSVDRARGAEAFTQIGVTKRSISRCNLTQSDYTACNTYTELDVDDPANALGSHFTYSIASGATTFSIQAVRNTLNNGDGTSSIYLDFDGNDYSYVTNGVFQGLQ